MTKYDRISTLFFIGVAIFICEESIRLGAGSLSSPGPGLIPLGSGLILGIFALIVLARTFVRNTSKGKGALWAQGTKWRNIVWGLLSMIAYAFLIDFLGFNLVTFLWMGFVCRGIGKMGWVPTIFTSVVTTLLSYLIFEHYLGVRFPHGTWGF
jgi:hypothetical protein